MVESIILTGATGFVGSHLARSLVNEGYQVNVIVRPSSKLTLLEELQDDINIFVYDGQVQNLIEFFCAVRAQTVVHLAALFIAEHQPEDIEALVASNISFGLQLLEAIAKSGVKYLVNTGSHWQNYNGGEYNPVNLYAATKEAFEVLAKYYLETTELRMLTIKLCDTYGPNDPRKKVIALFNRISNSQETLDMSPGEQELGLVYIDDVTKGFLLAIDQVKRMSEHEQTVKLLAPAQTYTLREVARIYQEVSGKSLRINWGARPYRQREMMKVSKREPNILANGDAIDLVEGLKVVLQQQDRAKR